MEQPPVFSRLHRTHCPEVDPVTSLVELFTQRAVILKSRAQTVILNPMV